MTVKVFRAGTKRLRKHSEETDMVHITTVGLVRETLTAYDNSPYLIVPRYQPIYAFFWPVR